MTVPRLPMDHPQSSGDSAKLAQREKVRPAAGKWP